MTEAWGGDVWQMTRLPSTLGESSEDPAGRSRNWLLFWMVIRHLALIGTKDLELFEGEMRRGDSSVAAAPGPSGEMAAGLPQNDRYWEDRQTHDRGCAQPCSRVSIRLETS